MPKVIPAKHTGAVVLAAGSSSRFGRPKQLLDWNGRPLVAHVAGVALSAGLRPVVVVVGPEAHRIRHALSKVFPDELRSGSLRLAANWEPGHRLSGSVRAGLSALPLDCRAALLIQADAPLVTEALMGALVERLSESGAAIAHPTVDGQLRPPVLFARDLFADLCALTGDQGGRVVVGNHLSEVATIELDHPDLVADIDTPADYDVLRAATPPAPRTRTLTTNVASLAAVRSLIIDMDGVLWRSNTPLPGLPEFFGFLREEEIGFTLATNNSSLLPAQYSAKLARFGVDVPADCVLTSSQATAAYVADACSPGARVHVIGGEGIRHELQANGLTLAEDRVECVVVGWDRALTWEKLARASLLIYRGAHFVGTNPDNSYPTEVGPAPGNGAQLAALRATTGVEPVVVGKPQPWLYEEAVRRMGTTHGTTAVVGDRLETDIAGGVRAGLTTILLFSGIASLDDVSASPTKPDLVFADIRDLVSSWREELRGGLRDTSSTSSG